MTGVSGTPNFPATPGALQTGPGSGFGSVLKAAGSQLLFSTYPDGFPTALALDSSGHIFLSGDTSSPNFPDNYGAFPSSPGLAAELD